MVVKTGLTQRMKTLNYTKKADVPKVDPRLAALAKYFDQTDE